MKNNQNVIIAIALSFLVIVGWQYSHRRAEDRGGAAAARGASSRSRRRHRRRHASAPRRASAPGRPERRRRAGSAGAPAPGAAVAGAVPRDAALAGSERVKIDTPSLKGSINLTGGRHRRSPARRLSRDRRAHEPAGPAVLAGRQRASLLRRFRLGRAAGRTRRSERRDEVDCRGRTARPGQGRDAHLGQRGRPRLQAHVLGRREVHVHRPPDGGEQDRRARSSSFPTASSAAPGCRRPPATTSCTRA